MIGATIGSYEVSGKLGEGGMGEVWRARDAKLGREVALKLLPEQVEADPDRLARFEREAKVLASLNHPNIATLYGLETAAPTSASSGAETGTGTGPVTFLVMELVEGEGLDEVIARGPTQVDEAVTIAMQIAEALEAAHERGIVHRDLKPSNVKLRPDGTVKVLDFGLAKAWEADEGDPAISLSPTVTKHQTAAGVILGTAAYMSPEQARGKPVDRRADIWAYGVVLWEMLTGRKLFEGDTVTDVLASVLKETPDLEALPADLPAPLRRLVARCLDKDARTRLQAIGEARVVLESPMEVDVAGGRPPDDGRQVRSGLRLPWVVAAVALAAAGVLTWLWLHPEPPPVVRASIPPPAASTFHLASISPGPAAVSPDGRALAFSARDAEGVVRLFVRDLDAPDAYVLSGTEGAQYPFWSPDGRWIAFFTQADGTLKKVDASGGPPVTVCDADDGKGGAWGSKDVIVFAPGPSDALHRVPASGGSSEPITEVDRERHNSHRNPRFLPDGEHVVYIARGVSAQESAVMVGSIEGGVDRELFPSQVHAEYAGGQLFLMRDGTLMAQPFDPDSLQLEGEAVPVAEGVLTIQGAALGIYSASPSGVLVYHTGSVSTSVAPAWFDRDGSQLGELGDAGEYNTVALSPDGRTAALSVTVPASGTFDLWTYDLERDVRTRFTFDDGMDFWPVWAPDGESLFFASDRGGSLDIYRMGIGGVSGPEPVLESERDLTPVAVDPDGRWLVYTEQAVDTGVDIWALPLTGEGEARPIRVNPGVDAAGSISPDGSWLAYFTDESGSFEVYVTPFPDAGRRWQVSTASGVYPFWCASGREIVYQQFDGQLMSAEVELGTGTVRLGATKPLFSIRPPEAIGTAFVPSADCERFLVIPAGEGSDSTLLNLMVGWDREIGSK
jgi:Tol biopolymer transport system component